MKWVYCVELRAYKLAIVWRTDRIK